MGAAGGRKTVCPVDRDKEKKGRREKDAAEMLLKQASERCWWLLELVLGVGSPKGQIPAEKKAV
jgi:hypothetical protein